MRIIAPLLLVYGCDTGVLSFPTPEQAGVRIVNVTQNLPVLRITIDSATVLDENRGESSDYSMVAAGRPVTFTIGTINEILRDNLRYTLGGGGRVILFVRGDTTSLVEFRREIQDTVLPQNSTSSVIRFTHMAQSVDKVCFLEVWVTGGSRLLPEEFELGHSSVTYTGIQPGTYSFEIREGGTANVLATLPNVKIDAARSYMLYTHDAEPPSIDIITLKIF